jgi:hypothetical protein
MTAKYPFGGRIRASHRRLPQHTGKIVGRR